MSKTVLFQTIQFSISTPFSFIWPIDRTLSGATIPGQSGPGSDDNEGVLHISPKLHYYRNLTIRLLSVISRTLVVRGSYLSAEKQSVYSTASADWANIRQEIDRFENSTSPKGGYTTDNKGIFFLWPLVGLFNFPHVNSSLSIHLIFVHSNFLKDPAMPHWTMDCPGYDTKLN